MPARAALVTSQYGHRNGLRVHGDFLPYLGGAIGRYRFDGNAFAGFAAGITGDPQLATAATGEKSYALIAAWIAAAVRHDLRPAGP
jgi:creatinine amidohydrolase